MLLVGWVGFGGEGEGRREGEREEGGWAYRACATTML